MEKIKILRYIIKLVLLFSFVLVLLLICLGVMLWFSGRFGISSSNDNYFRSKSDTFRKYRIDPNKKEFTSSTVELASKEESYFYRDEEGGYNFLSRFDTQQYKCTGSCHCDGDGDMRRGSVIPYTRSGLFFLVGAVSSVVAYKKAKNYFQNECEMSMEDICAESSAITVEVDDCKPYTEILRWIRKFVGLKRKDYEDEYDGIVEGEDQKTANEAKEEEYEEEEEEEYDPDEMYFDCTGRCRPIDVKEALDMTMDGVDPEDKKPFKIFFKKRFKKEAKKFKCLRVQHSDRITKEQIKEGSNHPEHEMQDFEQDYVENTGQDDFWLTLAHSYFASTLLNEVCIEQGKKTFPLPGDEKDAEEATLLLCEGWSGLLSGKNEYFHQKFNPTVKCVRH